MKKIHLIAVLMITNVITYAQVEEKPALSRPEINDLLKSVNKKLEDSTRIDICLKLADYNLQKDGNEKSDLDSAALFIRNAKEINTRQIPGKRDGLILFYESSFAIKSGDTEAGKKLINIAIEQLKNKNDELHLTLAYLELSRCYDSKKPGDAVVIKNLFNTLFQHVRTVVGSKQRDACLFELKCFYSFKMGGESYIMKLDYLDHLLSAYRIINDKLNEFWTRKEIADIHHQQGKLAVAINELLEIAKEQKAGAYPRICFTYDLLSGMYYLVADYDKALYYSLESIKNVSTALDSFYLIDFYARAAYCYTVSGSIGEAINWNLKAVSYMAATKRTDNIYSFLYYITVDLTRVGRAREALAMIIDKSKHFVPVNLAEKRSMLMTFATCYSAVKNKAMTEKYCSELIELHELRIKRKQVNSDPVVYRVLATANLRIGQYNKAEDYFKKAVNEMPGGTSIFYINDFLFRLDSAKGNYLSAIKHLQAAKAANDSAFTAKKNKQIEELKIVYKSEQQEQLINLKEQNIQLLTKQDLLQKNKLQQGALLRNISFAVLALLIIIMALLYNRYRLKRRTNKKLELQQHEIAEQNNSLHHLLDEKEWLLKEIHHRVKNNLQIVMSLLNSQSAFIDNEPALTAIHDSQHRVHAMSLIHQKLYGSENVSSIDMSFYIRELVSYLADSFDTGQRIRFELNIEPLELDVSQAVPLGLILNEAITNSIKYAFPGTKEGIITVSLINAGPHNYLLTIADNGVGMPVQFKNKKPGSLGMSLMAGLSEDLDGAFSIENNNGTLIKIFFVHDSNVKRPHTLTPAIITNN